MQSQLIAFIQGGTVYYIRSLSWQWSLFLNRARVATPISAAAICLLSQLESFLTCYSLRRTLQIAKKEDSKKVPQICDNASAADHASSVSCVSFITTLML